MGYVVSFLHDLHINVPAALCQSPFNYLPEKGWMLTGNILNFPAMFIVILVTSLLVIGIKESVTFNNVIVIVKLIVILLFIFFGMWYINVDNWSPFIPDNTGVFGHFGWSGVLTGSGVIFFAYIGFDAVSTAAQESKNPQKHMPIGILVSLVVCILLIS